jgi:hypothetical protein
MSRDDLPSQRQQHHQQLQQQQNNLSKSPFNVASPSESKFVIKKEVLEDENHQEENEEEETDISNLSKTVDHSTKDVSNSSEPKPNVDSVSDRPKDRTSDNFEQFWMLVRPRVLSNLSLWDFLSDKTRFNVADISTNDQLNATAEVSSIDRKKDVAKLDFLLQEVELLIEQVVDVITTCCSTTFDENVENVVDVRGKFSTLFLLPFLNCDGQNGRHQVRLKSRSEIPKKIQNQLFDDVPSAEAEDLNDVSFYWKAIKNIRQFFFLILHF